MTITREQLQDIAAAAFPENIEHGARCLQAIQRALSLRSTGGGSEPVAWTTAPGLAASKYALGFEVSAVNLWGDRGIPLYAAPQAVPRDEAAGPLETVPFATPAMPAEAAPQSLSSSTAPIEEAAAAIKTMMVGEHLFSCINGQRGNAPSDRCAPACQRLRAALAKMESLSSAKGRRE